MGRYAWSRLNSHQVGRFAEYFVKMEFALYGFEIYSSEVDDRRITSRPYAFAQPLLQQLLRR